jgi:hypothetical protein
MQLYFNEKNIVEDGVVIQIKKKNYKSGTNKTKSMTIYGEEVEIAFGRIYNLYEKLSTSTEDEVLIRHKK